MLKLQIEIYVYTFNLFFFFGYQQLFAKLPLESAYKIQYRLENSKARLWLQNIMKF